jgi:hypothetical protein
MATMAGRCERCKVTLPDIDPLVCHSLYLDDLTPKVLCGDRILLCNDCYDKFDNWLNRIPEHDRGEDE